MSSTKKNPKGMLPRGGVTVAVIKYEDENYMRFGAIACVKSDMFCKREGMEKAYYECNSNNALIYKTEKKINIIRGISNSIAIKIFKKKKLDVIQSRCTMEEIANAVEFIVSERIKKAQVTSTS